MRYRDGTNVMVGDSVCVDEVFFGKVVISFDDQIFSAEYPESEWKSAGEAGVLVAFENGSRLGLKQSNDDGVGPPLLRKVVSDMQKGIGNIPPLAIG